MIRTPIRLAFLVAMALAAPAWAGDRTADEIVRAIEATPVKRDAAQTIHPNAARSELIGELLGKYPDDPRLARYLPERWQFLGEEGKFVALKVELDRVQAKTADPAVRVEVAYVRAGLALESDDADRPAVRSAVDAFARMAPKDDRAALLLYMLAYGEPVLAQRVGVEDRILKDYPRGQAAGLVESDRRQRSFIGKPFEHRFTDAISGKPIAIDQYRGKVVVVDFWATWCGPCMEALPRMKAIHDRYQGRGVEFIGVSLDRAGALDKIKKVVADQQLPWPQDYEGKRFETELVRRYEITSIPTVFVVDQAGNLASVKGVLDLEATLDGLLKDPPKPTQP